MMYTVAATTKNTKIKNLGKTKMVTVNIFSPNPFVSRVAAFLNQAISVSTSSAIGFRYFS